MAGTKKSLNKLWREMGKPVPFKDFAEEYNKADLYDKKIENIYHNASGVTDNSSAANTTPQVSPSVSTSFNNYYLVGAIVLVIGGILIAQNLSKKSG